METSMQGKGGGFRGIFSCLPLKIHINTMDFKIALYLSIPVEQNIDITVAMLAWCDEWRHFLDEKHKKEEFYRATRNSSGGPYEDSDQYEEDRNIGLTTGYRTPLNTEDNETEPDPKVLEIGRKKDPKVEEREKDTETKINKIITDCILHYFQEFQEMIL